MDDTIFEFHELNRKEFPFIFHKNCHIENVTDKKHFHWHPNIELLYFIDGDGQVFCGTQSYNVTKGDFFIVNSNMPHTFISVPGVLYHCLIVDRPFCEANDIYVENLNFQILFRDEQANRLFEQVVDELECDRPYKDTAVKASVLNLLLYLARNHAAASATQVPSFSPKEENLYLAMGYINANIGKKLTLNEIAAEAGLSKYHFLREFKKITGETPIAYINKIRCENAKKMILSGRYSMKDVCEQSGFESLSYFAKRFQECVGMTPSEFKVRYFPKH